MSRNQDTSGIGPQRAHRAQRKVNRRWLSNNPIGISGGLNQYVFCGNDPVNNADPSGLAVGGPGIVEGFIPIWGSGRQVINDFQTGCYGWGMVNTVVAVSDVFLVKTLAQMAGKGLWKTADKWHKMIEGKCPRLNPAKRWWHGTPDWFRYAKISGVGRAANAMQGENAK